jgi:hypothetical protein
MPLLQSTAVSVQDGLEQGLNTKLQASASVLEVKPLADFGTRYLQHSPYTEQEHQLDLHALDSENALLSRALAHMRNTREDYATAPYTKSFNWSEVMEKLKEIVKASGQEFKATSWYIVAFRSQIPPTTVYADLGVLDKAAHAEANASGGFLK